MNWIQQHVLLELTRQPSLRYSQLRPDGVEGNLFLYHLDGLIKDGLVEKADRTYRLSDKGLALAGTLSLSTGKPRTQPKILNAIICRDETGRYLFSRWHRQPNTGLVSFPHGMMHFGAILTEMASLELSEKTGLVADLAYRGQVYVRGLRGDEVDRHLLVNLFEAKTPSSAEVHSNRPEVSEPFWAELADLKPADFVPGFYEIAKIVDTGSSEPILADITVSLPAKN